MNDREHQEQVNLFTWARLMLPEYPELEWMLAIPNGGHRHKSVAAKLKAEGVKAGVADIFLPVARGGYHGLFIELKVGRNKATGPQVEFLEAMMGQGYRCAICYGWRACVDVIEEYLKNK